MSVIVIAKEGLRPAIAALCHVMRQAGNNDTGETSHHSSSHRRPGTSIECTVTVIPAGMNQQSFDRAVIDAAQSYQAPSYNFWSGPNSNSAAALPIFRAGGQLPKLNFPTPFGARALDYWQTHTYPAQ